MGVSRAPAPGRPPRSAGGGGGGVEEAGGDEVADGGEVGGGEGAADAGGRADVSEVEGVGPGGMEGVDGKAGGEEVSAAGIFAEAEFFKGVAFPGEADFGRVASVFPEEDSEQGDVGPEAVGAGALVFAGEGTEEAEGEGRGDEVDGRGAEAEHDFGEGSGVGGMVGGEVDEAVGFVNQDNFGIAWGIVEGVGLAGAAVDGPGGDVVFAGMGEGEQRAAVAHGVKAGLDAAAVEQDAGFVAEGPETGVASGKGEAVGEGVEGVFPENGGAAGEGGGGCGSSHGGSPTDCGLCVGHEVGGLLRVRSRFRFPVGGGIPGRVAQGCSPPYRSRETV